MSEQDGLNAALEMADEADPITVAYDDETIVWQGRPSQWVNLGTFLFWLFFLVSASTVLLLWNAGLRDDYAPFIGEAVVWACLGLLLISTMAPLHAFLSVLYEHTAITKNKIKEAKGITRIFRRELYCEISDIKDVKSPAAGLLGILGLSTLVIETNDEDQPIIKIRAIRDREELIQKLLPIWRELKIQRKGYFGDR